MITDPNHTETGTFIKIVTIIKHILSTNNHYENLLLFSNFHLTNLTAEQWLSSSLEVSKMVMKFI